MRPTSERDSDLHADHTANAEHSDYVEHTDNPEHTDRADLADRSAESGPWHDAPGHLRHDGDPADATDVEGTHHVPEQRGPDHDGHLYTGATYDDPPTGAVGPEPAYPVHASDETQGDTAPAADRDHDGVPDAVVAVVPVPQARADEARADEARADEARADEAEADEARAHESAAHETPADERVADEPVADELKPGDLPAATVGAFLDDAAVQGLRDRWREAQLGFIDDPRQAAEDVKNLVDEAVEKFTAALASQRDELEATSGADTEQYRMAVQRYRMFFDRLLNL
jgi:hypothetical protein